MHIENAAGVKAGGRTGLTGVVVALLFLASLLLSPLAGSVSAYPAAPALLFVACLMCRGLTEFDWEDVTEVAPEIVAAIAMPLTFSIANGIGFGLISYAGIKILAGRFGDLNTTTLVLAALFAIKYSFFR
jgi:adenine/guanine/hypoxanthine permease